MKKGITRLLFLTVVLVLMISILSACDKPASSDEKAVNDGPFTITIENGYINDDPSMTTGLFMKNEEVTITAIVPKGQEFVKWYKTGVPSSSFSTKNPYKFTVATNRQLSALFQSVSAAKYDVSVTNGYIGDNKSTRSGKYEEDSVITLTAIVPTGKEFAGWYVDGKCISKDNPYNYTVTKKVTINGNLRNEGEDPEEEQYCLLTVNGGKIKNSTLTSKTFNNSDIVVVTATVPATKNFEGWYENNVKVSSKEEYTFVIKYSRTLEARCVDKPYYSIDVNDGTINTENSVMQGTEVTFTANTDTDRSEFEKWTIITNGSAKEYSTREVTIEVKDNVVATASYYTKVLVSAYIKGEQEPYEYAYIRSGSGMKEFTAPNREGVSFNRWLDEGGNRITSSSKIQIQSKVEDYSIYAEYVEVEQGYCKVSIFMGEAYSSYSSGTYSGTKYGSDFIALQGTAIYIKPTLENADVTYDNSKEDAYNITLAPSTGHKLTLNSLSYEVNCIETIPVTMTNCTCTTPYVEELIVGKTYVFQESFNLDDYAFVQWKVNNVASIGTPSVVDGIHYITVTITQDMESLNVNISLKSKFNIVLNNGTFDDGTTSGNFVAGSFVNIHADSIPAKRFVRWECDGSFVSSDADCQLTVIDDATYTAVYENIE